MQNLRENLRLELQGDRRFDRLREIPPIKIYEYHRAWGRLWDTLKEEYEDAQNCKRAVLNELRRENELDQEWIFL